MKAQQTTTIKKTYFATRNHGFFFTGNFGQKTPHGFFVPMPNLTRMPFWTS